MYRAFQAVGDGQFELVDRELAAPEPGHVRIRVEPLGQDGSGNAGPGEENLHDTSRGFDDRRIGLACVGVYPA